MPTMSLRPETYFADRIRQVTAVTLTGLTASLGLFAVAEAQPGEQVEIGTAAVAHSLDCRGAGERVLEELGPDKEVSISAKTAFNSVGSVSLRFLETDSGQLYIDFGNRENLMVEKQELADPSHDYEVRQSFRVRKNRIAVMRLFALTDKETSSTQAYVEGRCVSVKQNERELKKPQASPKTTIVASVPK